MKQRHIIAFLSAAVVIGCAGQMGGGPPGPPASLTVFPTFVLPGGLVHAALPGGEFATREDLRVTIGGEPAAILRVVDDDSLDIIVPIIPPDSVTLVLRDKDGVFATGDLRVGPSATVLIVLAVTDSVHVLRTLPSTDRPTRDVPSSEARLSFDVISLGGTLLHSCSVLDPTRALGEALVPATPDQVTLGRGGLSVDGTVGIRVPRFSGTVTLVSYRVAPGLDIRTQEGRAQRTLINQAALSL